MASLEKILDECSTLRALIIKTRPYDEGQWRALKSFYRAQCVWSSNALEGNTISLNETKFIIEKGFTIHGHSLREIAECTGGAKSFDAIFDEIKSGTISETYIKNLHYLFSEDISDIPCPGSYRDKSKTYVYIEGSAYPCPDYDKVPTLMKEFIEWISDMRNKLHPVALAAEAHRRFSYIHPFPDGNGRVARLLMNTILTQFQYLPIAIKPTRRKKYIKLLEDGRAAPKLFDIFIAENELKEEKRFLALLDYQ